MAAASPEEPRPAADLVLALAIAVAVILLQLPYRLSAPNLIDEGAILEIATELLAGRRLYVDVFHPAFPGVHWLVAAVFALAGPSLDAARTIAAVLFGLTTGVAFLIARWFLSRRGAVAVAILFVSYRVWAYPHWHMVSYSSLAVGLLLGSTWVLGEALRDARPAPYAVAGLVAGAAAITKQDSGAAGAAALALAVLFCGPSPASARLRCLGAFAAGIALVVGLTGVAILRAGIAADWLQQTIVGPLYGIRTFPYPGRPAAWPLLRQDPAMRAASFSYFPPIVLDAWPAIFNSTLYRDTAVVDAGLKLVYYAPWIVFVLATGSAFAQRWRRGRPGDLRDAREWLLLLLAAAFLVAFNRPHDWIHLLVLYPPTLLLGAVLAGRVVARWPRTGGSLVVLGLAGATAMSVFLVVQFGRQYSTRVDTIRGPVYAPVGQAHALEEVLAALSTAAPPDAPLAALPYHPLLNFLSGRRVLSRYYAVWPVDPDPHREDEIVRDLEDNPDGLVVYSPTQVPHFPPLGEYAPKLAAYLANHFTVARTIGANGAAYRFLLLARTPQEEGRSLLERPVSPRMRGAMPPSFRLTIRSTGG